MKYYDDQGNKLNIRTELDEILLSKSFLIADSTISSIDNPVSAAHCKSGSTY